MSEWFTKLYWIYNSDLPEGRGSSREYWTWELDESQMLHQSSKGAPCDGKTLQGRCLIDLSANASQNPEMDINLLGSPNCQLTNLQRMVTTSLKQLTYWLTWRTLNLDER